MRAIDGPLTNTKPIKVRFDSEGTYTFTTPSAVAGAPKSSESIWNFVSANPSYGVGYDGDELKLDTAATAPSDINATPTDIAAIYRDDEVGSYTANATAANEHEIVGYLWYKNTSNSTEGGTLIEGAVNKTYTPSTDQDTGVYYYYYAVRSMNSARKVVREDLSNVVKLQINKATPEYTKEVTTITGLTENGSPQQLATAGAVSGGTLQYALGVDEKTVPAEGWSTDIPTGTKAGKYYVFCRIKGDSNYEDVEAKYCGMAVIEEVEEIVPEPKAPATGDGGGAIPYVSLLLMLLATITMAGRLKPSKRM